MSEVPNGTTTTAATKQPTPGAGLVGAACAAAQPMVPVPVPSNNSSAMQFFAQDPNDDRDAVSTIPCIQRCGLWFICFAFGLFMMERDSALFASLVCLLSF